jgi:hypothetical protein
MPTDPTFSVGIIPPPPMPIPRAPRLHWGWALAINVLTRSLFAIVWLVVQANWVRRVRGRSNAFRWAIAHLCAFPVLIIILGLALFVPAKDDSASQGLIFACGMVAFSGFWVATVFTLRSELKQSPIGIPLSGVMTLLFGPIYFQYFLHDFDPNSSSLIANGVLGLSQPQE